MEDLKDLGEIGRGITGKVSKMLHKPTGRVMAAKVRLQGVRAAGGDVGSGEDVGSGGDMGGAYGDWSESDGGSGLYE